MSCDARIAPFPDKAVIVDCEVGDIDHDPHVGVLRDYAFEGSRTELTWFEDDRRTFRGEWVPCAADAKCILPCNHPGRCAR